MYFRSWQISLGSHFVTSLQQTQPKWQSYHHLMPSHVMQFWIFWCLKLFSFLFWVFILVLQMTLKQLPGNSNSEFQLSHFLAWRMTQCNGFWLISVSSVFKFELSCCAPLFKMLTFFFPYKLEIAFCFVLHSGSWIWVVFCRSVCPSLCIVIPE